MDTIGTHNTPLPTGTRPAPLLGLLASLATECPLTAGPTPPAPLTGRLSRSALAAYPGCEQWWAQGYDPDPVAIAAICEHAAGIEIIAFIATWCGDSKRDVPRFYKILAQAGIAEAQVAVYGLDRTKQDAAGLTARWRVEFVPTFIILRDGRELGRVVEKPKGTLEGDLAAILTRP